MSTKHSPTCKRAFSNYDASCSRCQELKTGSPARKGWNAIKQNNLTALISAIHAHDCKQSGCAVVCTAFDY